MGLYERLMGFGLEEKIAVHDFMAALGEVERGKWTGAQVAASFGLDATAQAEASTLIARVIGAPEYISLGGFVILTNIGSTYDLTPAARGLGFVGLQVGGITRLDLAVRVSKIGTGTQSWQLWNETDGTELGVIDDAGAAGDKQLTVNITPPAPLVPGIKFVRIRAKSTVAADDPVYYGASIRILRVERLTSVEVHEILILGETRRGPTTVAELKARLGV